jgi:hypothetical protein
MTHSRTLVAVLVMAMMLVDGCASEKARPDDWRSNRDDWRANSGRGLTTNNQGDAYTALALAALYVGAITTVGTAEVIGDIAKSVSGPGHEGTPSPETEPIRLLQTVQGNLRDSEGRPIAGATLLVREAAQYTAMPERLAAHTVCTGADGAFTLMMAKADAVCVDFAADRMRPMRRWFVVATPRALAALPEDRTEILLVTPYAHEVRVVPMGLVMETEP